MKIAVFSPILFPSSFLHLLKHTLFLKNLYTNFNNFKKELESWAASSAKEWIGSATQQLKHAQQTISILMINKSVLENADVREEICPDLTPAQVYFLKQTTKKTKSEKHKKFAYSKRAGLISFFYSLFL
jgi:hypothetical protein